MEQLQLGKRAGLGRRLAALAVDVMLLWALLIALSVATFALSDGRLQVSVRFEPPQCRQINIPADWKLEPPVAAGTDYRALCEVTVLGWPTSRLLTTARHMPAPGEVNGPFDVISRTESFGTGSATIFFRVLDLQAYRIDRSGAAGAHDISFIVPVAALLGTIVVIAVWGRTPGHRLLGLHIVRRETPRTTGAGWPRAAVRVLALLVFPALYLAPGEIHRMVFQLLRPADGYTPASLQNTYVAVSMQITLIAGPILVTIAGLWALYAISRKRDPFWDRWAGTALLAGPASAATI